MSHLVALFYKHLGVVPELDVTVADYQYKAQPARFEYIASRQRFEYRAHPARFEYVATELNMGSTAAAQRPIALVGEKPNFAADMRPKLQNGELITGTPTVTDIDGTGDLTITSISRNNSATIECVNDTVPIDSAVKFHVEGFIADKVYNLMVTIVTDAGATRKQKIILPSEAS